MFVLMSTYLFEGAIAGSTAAYLDDILPGVLVMSVLFTTVSSGVALNTDRTKGVIDRFRSLPVWRAAPLLGSLLGDAVRFVVAGMDGGFTSIFPLTSLSDVFVAPATLPSCGPSSRSTRSRCWRRLPAGSWTARRRAGTSPGCCSSPRGSPRVFAPLTTLLDRRG